MTHPEFFGGVWAVSPDPVDFRHFSYAGDHDDYGLNKAVLSLKSILKTLGAEAVLETLHGNHML